MPTLRRRDRSLENKNTLIPNANLLAASSIEPDSVISSDSSIGHNSVSEKNFLQINSFYNRVGKIGINNISSHTSRSRQVSTSQIDFPKTSISQFGTSQVSTSQINSADTSFYQTSSSQVGTSQVNVLQSTDINSSLTQIGVAKIDSNNINTLQKSSAEIDSLENSNAQFLPISQIDTTKIPLTSSISPKQFFNSHNLTPQIINELNNSATKIWSDLLQTETQLNIDFQITDLPSGQLAEATITGFDSSGVPNAGTIFIDHDANGVGWFVDRTLKKMNNSLLKVC